MDAICYKRDFHSLSYCRKKTWLPRRIFRGQLVEVSPDRATRRENLNKRRDRLNSISKGLRKFLHRNHTLISCISFATQLLSPAVESIAPLELSKRPLAPDRPDSDFEEDVIRARLATARDNFSTRILIDSLKRVNQAIMQINIDLWTTFQQPRFFY